MISTTLRRVVRAGGNTIQNYSLFIIFIILGTGAVYFHIIGHQPFCNINEMREENFLLDIIVMYELENWSECSLLQISSDLVCLPIADSIDLFLLACCFMGMFI